MLTPEKRQYFEALLERLSDAEKFAFGEILSFLKNHPESSGLLDSAREAECKNWEEALLYLYENYEAVPSHP